MNPNASVFIPSMRADPAEQRVSQIQFLTKQIEYTKQELAVNNGELVKLHNVLTTQHTHLIDEMQRRENGEFPCNTQEQIDYLAEDYKKRSTIYYSKYTKFNDKTSELVTLQQKLHRLLLAPMPPSNQMPHQQQQQHAEPQQHPQTALYPQQQPQLHSPSPSQQHLLNEQQSVSTAACTTESDESQSSQSTRLSVLDGIDMNYSYSPPATPHSVLPPIMESDAEYPWMECDESTSENTSKASIASHGKHKRTSSLFKFSLKANSKQHSVSDQAAETETETDTKAKRANQAYSDCNKENIDPTSTHSQLDQCNNFNTPHSDFSSMIHLIEQRCNDMQIQTENAHTVNIQQHTVEHTVTTQAVLHDGVDYNQLESEINGMLENMMYCDIETMCVEFHKFVHARCGTHKSLELLIERIISHGIANKPEFFGTKYSLLCQSIVAQFQPTTPMPATTRSSQQQSKDEWMKVQRVNLSEMVWSSCLENFKKLQFGNDGEKFINVMIIIAELLNAELISAQQVFNNVFKLILSECNSNLCENDIEGLYEIFKRCHRSLVTPQNKIHLHKYFHILDKIKNLEKFKTGMHRVPFMVNQMKGFANKSNQYQYKRKW